MDGIRRIMGRLAVGGQEAGPEADAMLDWEHGGGVLYVIAGGQAGFDLSAGFASNGYGAHSPGGYSLLGALLCEVVMTMMFLLIILGATDKRAPQGFAPIALSAAPKTDRWNPALEAGSKGV